MSVEQVSVHPRTKALALKALDRVKEIAENEMLESGSYIFDEVDEEKRKAGAICGGHKACLIGSLWIGGGVKLERMGRSVDLPGTEEGDRRDFLARRPSLRLAYRALNQAAVTKIKRMGGGYAQYLTNDDGDGDTTPGLGSYASAAEGLFESILASVLAPNDSQAIRREVLRVVASARRLIETDRVKQDVVADWVREEAA